LAPEDTTWKEVEQLQQQFPLVNLANKVLLQGGRMIITQPCHFEPRGFINPTQNTWSLRMTAKQGARDYVDKQEEIAAQGVNLQELGVQ
jgi:hypothetical protein